MTGARLTATLDDAQLAGGIQRLRELLHDTTPVMRAIGARLAANSEDRLGGTKDPQGNDWAPLSPAYAAVKRMPGMLKERGAQGGLLASITFEASPGVVIVGSNKVYAAIHQFGGKIVPKNAKALVFKIGDRVIRRKSVTIPARPYLGIGPEDEAVIYRVVDGAIERALFGRAV
jgi:phage virion morphogenesis protein